ncbi:MOSC domain-containing protein [Haloarcula onubensis]|uniref:MOSC N-terminal beta barrel domain-containing protein n=1 Tax=Haloarcula onubensis TaxID=2950539 RepID=A0ABU2FRQ2_9EURY|nr:MOSC N-terminal beta barrel domain-containing protein [Halomicroarcula sp. S3CR25-11]MDS0283438.1 MOSC N-terminal beta barrel domain-containing protein [Halomicroarcula sp. S3CR25-11]
MAHIDRLTVYPVKGLDRLDVDRSRVLPGGTLEHDREFALLDADGERVNAKQSGRFHALSTAYDPETVTLRVASPERREFALDTESSRAEAAAWLADALGLDGDLRLDHSPDLGHVDRQSMGPSVVSTATLETVADWFEGVTVDGARRRLRANIEVGGVPAFWEDRFVGADAPAFRAGDVRIEGVTPCGRCVVPSRDPDSGEPTPEFRERFVRRRRETFPDWADPEAFDHFYTMMLIARVPEADRGATISVGDDVEIVA